jgi:hypothetical protein
MTFSPQLKAKLAPAHKRAREWVAALDRISPTCLCSDTTYRDGRIDPKPACPARPGACLGVTVVAIRVAMNLLRLPHRHLSDQALVDAVRALGHVFDGLATADDEQVFVRQIADALRAPQDQEASQ